MSYKPKKGSSYFMVNSRFQVKQTENTGSQKSADRIAAGNAFRTHAEAEQFRDYITDLALHGARPVPAKPGFIAKILTWLVYILLALMVLAAICLVIDFIFWIYDIKVKLPL